MMIRRFALLAAIVTVVASCGWARTRFDGSNTGANPFESKISASNVASLTKQATMTGGVGTPILVVRGNVLSASGNAYAIDGPDHCAGTPAVCTPVSQTPSFPPPDIDAGVLFHGKDAYDPDGKVGCSGDPAICAPLWSGSTGSASGTVDPADLHFTSSSVGAHGSVEVSIYGYSKTGDVACSGVPKVCAPRWSALAFSGGTGASVDLAGPRDSVLYDSVGGSLGGRLEARNAASAMGEVLWSAGLGDGGFRPPVLVGDLIIAYGRSSTNQWWAAYRADGSAGCTGTPKTCSPLWITDKTAVGYTDGALAVSGGRIYRTTTGSVLKVYDAAGVGGCTGAGVANCVPLWSAATGGSGGPIASPAVANGLVFVGADDGTVKAFDAHGVANCSGAPKVCTPLWTGHVSGSVGDVIVSGGRLFVPSSDGNVTVFSLP